MLLDSHGCDLSDFTLMSIVASQGDGNPAVTVDAVQYNAAHTFSAGMKLNNMLLRQQI